MNQRVVDATEVETTRSSSKASLVPISTSRTVVLNLFSITPPLSNFPLFHAP